MDDTDPFTLTPDASLFGIGAVISQRQQWGKRVIAYANKTIGKSQWNFSATIWEVFAIVYFTQHFRNYLLGQKFLIVTTIGPSRGYSFNEPDGLCARWIENLGKFDFEKKIPHADSLLRVPQTEDQVKDSNHKNQVNTEDKII